MPRRTPQPVVASIALAIALTTAADVHAQGTTDRRWSYEGSTGYVHVADGDAISMTLGGTRFWKWFGLTVTPVDLAVIGQTNERYYEDTFDNGQTRCRDSETGQFASDSKCVGSKALFAASAFARVNIPHRDNEWYVGAGYRAGNTATPFGALGFVREPDGFGAWYLELRAGQDLVQASIGVTMNNPFWTRAK